MPLPLSFAETMVYDLDQETILRNTAWLKDDKEFPTIPTQMSLSLKTCEPLPVEWHWVSELDEDEKALHSAPTAHDPSWEFVQNGLHHSFAEITHRTAHLSIPPAPPKPARANPPRAPIKLPAIASVHDVDDDYDYDDDISSLSYGMIEARKSMSTKGVKGSRRRRRRIIDILNISRIADDYREHTPESETSPWTYGFPPNRDANIEFMKCIKCDALKPRRFQLRFAPSKTRTAAEDRTHSRHSRHTNYNEYDLLE